MRQQTVDMANTIHYKEQLNAFHTSGLPILNTAMKDMLLYLQGGGGFQHDMAAFMRKGKKNLILWVTEWTMLKLKWGNSPWPTTN